MIVVYLAAGAFCGMLAALVTFFSGAGLGLAFLSYMFGGSFGVLASAMILSIPRGPGPHLEFATTS